MLQLIVGMLVAPPPTGLSCAIFNSCTILFGCLFPGLAKVIFHILVWSEVALDIGFDENIAVGTAPKGSQRAP